MSAASGKERAAKKVKRQKQFIAVGSVVLFAILGFEMTKLLSHGESASPTPATTVSSVAGSVPSPSPTSTSAWKLPDTDRIVVQRNADQLLSFGLFGSKDPFVQQLSKAPAPPPSPIPAPSPAPTTTTTTTQSQPPGVGLTPVTTTTATAPAPNASSPSTPGPTSTAPAPPGSTSPSTPTIPESAPATVLISTNGTCEQISVEGTFPNGEDIFRLVSIAKDGKSVEIGVVGGSYDSGQPTATLKLGEKLTLVNTADGTRYVIALKAKCAVVVQPTRSANATPATTTQATATPIPSAPGTTTTTPTATTPIVPDSLDTTVPTN